MNEQHLIDKEFALKAKEKALTALRMVHSILSDYNDWSDPKMKIIHKGIGLSIGTIDTQILCNIYKQYPELEDLK